MHPTRPGSKIPIVDGKAAKPEVVLSAIGLDDFDFDPAGNLYGATHVYNSLIRIDPQKNVTVLAGLAQGMAGSTAVAVRAEKTGLQAWVVTNGGMSLPPEGGVQTGKVLRVDLARRPWDLAHQGLLAPSEGCP
jgi:hypothetical protein